MVKKGIVVRKGIALLLILFIGFSPVMNAFADCLESTHSESEHASSASVTADDPAKMPVTHDRQGEADRHGNQLDVSCDAGVTCIFHLCGGLGVTGSIRFTTFLLSKKYPPSMLASLNSRAFAPKLEPPIRIF